jgi:hypothetical protein
LEYFKVSAAYPDLYKAVAKIFEDYGVSRDIKVVMKEENPNRDTSESLYETKNPRRD